MRHAYLILAHNEFEVTKRLLQSIDDERNDIYIHFDRKLGILPDFKVEYANLFYLKDRVDVCWGDISVVEAEYKLFELASKNKYEYYHLLSGVDLPLKSQDQIHNFFNKHRGKEFIGFSQYDYSLEVARKVNYIHLFAKNFRHDGSMKSLFRKVVRAAYLNFQIFFNIKRNSKIQFKKGTQWVSITNNFVNELLRQKNDVLKIYNSTFCADEIYKQTVCWNSSFKNNVYNGIDEALGCQRAIGWKDGVLYDWLNKDYEKLIGSDLIFARKFNSKNLEIVDNLIRRTL